MANDLFELGAEDCIGSRASLLHLLGESCRSVKHHKVELIVNDRDNYVDKMIGWVVLVRAHHASLWCVCYGHSGARGFFLSNCTLVKQRDTGVQSCSEYLAVSSGTVLVDYCDVEREDLLGIGHSLDDAFE